MAARLPAYRGDGARVQLPLGFRDGRTVGYSFPKRRSTTKRPRRPASSTATAWLGPDPGCLNGAAPERCPLLRKLLLQRQDTAEALEMNALGLVEHLPQLLQELTDPLPVE